MRVLICGGAGYIGSHMSALLLRAGHEVHVLDNFSTGFRWAVGDLSVFDVDLLDKNALSDVFSSVSFDAVMHFSAKSIVGESIVDPQKYFRNNVEGALNLLSAMLHAGVLKFIFSSTAAVYGDPSNSTLDESHSRSPINPYGESKLMVEVMLRSFAKAYGFNSVSFRYFNAAGADPQQNIGEAHEPETHLIPNIMRSLLSPDQNRSFKIFGDDYATPDGTCIRDYVHVSDIAKAHMLALEFLENNSGAHVFNLGSGTGFSVKEVIAACERVTGCKVQYQIVERREGDPAILVADSRKARETLGWTLDYPSIDSIVATAWRWHQYFHRSDSKG